MSDFKITKERIERVARMYKTSGDAAKAMGIALTTFSKKCKKFGIETPTQRTNRVACPSMTK